MNHGLYSASLGVFILLTVDPVTEMGKKRKVLSQEEIWDDSALIQSWDEALAEYKVGYWHYREGVSLLISIRQAVP